MNFLKDDNSIYCRDIIGYGNWYLNHTEHPLMGNIPETFDEYWNKTIKKQIRTEWRKAQKSNCKLRRIYNISPVNDEVIEIWRSQKNRKRTKRWRYGNDIFQYCDPFFKRWTFFDRWPIRDYSVYNCPKHNLEFWVVEKDNKVVAYMSTIRIGELSIVGSIFGHSDFIKYGIMKFMFVEIIRKYIQEKIIKYISYGFKEFLEDNRKYLSEQLNIIYDINSRTND